MKLHENIRKYRLDNDLTQEQLADKIGVTAQAVSKWERADSLPDAAMIPSIAKVLGVSTDELYGYVGTSKQALCRSIFAYFHRDSIDAYKEMSEIMWTALMSVPNSFHRSYSDLNYSNNCECFHNFTELSDDCTVKFTAHPDFPYLVFASRPENGWVKAFEDDEKLRRKFLALSDASTVRALRWLYEHKGGYRFEVPVLLTKAGISEDEGGKVIENLRELGVISCEDIDFDGVKRNICSYFPQEELLIVWMILRDFMYNHNGFEYQRTSIDRAMIG